MFGLGEIKRANKRAVGRDLRLDAYRAQWDIMRRALVKIAACEEPSTAAIAQTAINQVDYHRANMSAAA